MKGVVFVSFTTLDDSDIETKHSFPYQDFPSISFGSGTIQKEDTFRYAKRNAQGLMRRIGWIGYQLRIECKWALLTAQQYKNLLDLTSAQYFTVRLRWKGETKLCDFYAGNISATPYRLDKGGNPLYYTDVSFPIISMETLKQ